MALIFCPECKKEISDESAACVHCGYPVKPESSEPLFCEYRVRKIKYGLIFCIAMLPITIAVKAPIAIGFAVLGILVCSIKLMNMKKK